MALPKCFKKTSRAMISSRDRFMIHGGRGPLERNIELLKARDFESLRKRSRIRTAPDPLLENEGVLQNFDFQTMANSIHQLNYRPFDIRHGIYYTINKKCGKSIILDHLVEREPLTLRHNICAACDEYYDPEFFADPILSNTIALNYVQSIQQPPYSHIFLTRGLVDSGLFGYSTSKCSPIWIKGEANISPQLWQEISAIAPDVKPFEIFGYLYAILNCTPFLEIYEPLLLHEYPRIPYKVTKGEFYAMAQKGIELMDLHVSNLKNREIELIDTAFQTYWGGVDFGLASFSHDKEMHILHLYDQNKQIRLKVPCSPSMWEYKIGSVKILPNWCKSRRFKTLERNILEQDVWELSIILYSIQRTLDIKGHIAEIFNKFDLFGGL